MKSAKTSLLSAVIASTCCVVPLLLVLAGVGTLGLSAKFAQYDWLFAIIGISLLIFSYRQYFRERKRCSSEACEMRGKRFTQVSLLFSTLVILFVIGLMGFSRLSVSSGEASTTDMTALEPASKVEDPSFGKLAALAAGAQQVTLQVDGMTCASCAWGIEAALKHTSGVLSAKVSLKEKQAVIQYNPQEVTPQQLTDAINKLGYKASVRVSAEAEM